MSDGTMRFLSSPVLQYASLKNYVPVLTLLQNISYQVNFDFDCVPNMWCDTRMKNARQLKNGTVKYRYYNINPTKLQLKGLD